MADFTSRLLVNQLNAQHIVAQDGIETPSLKINGAIFNGDLSGAVSLPYLESNYVKKADASILQDLSSDANSLTLSKQLIVGSAQIEHLNAPALSTAMLDQGDNNVPNLGYVKREFAFKNDTFSKTEVANRLIPKLDSSTFSAYQAQMSSQLGAKADTSNVYSQQQVDNLVAPKVDTATLSTFQNSVNSQLASKADVGVSFTKAETNNLLGGKVDIGTYTTALQGKLDVTTHNSFVSSTSNSLSLKANSTDVFSKSETNNLLSTKQNVLSNATILSAIDQSLGTTATPTFGNVISTGAVTAANHLVTKAYVDNAASVSVTAGTGLTKSGSALSVNPSQSLTALTVAGNTILNVSTTGYFAIKNNDAWLSFVDSTKFEITGRLSVLNNVTAQNLTLSGNLIASSGNFSGQTTFPGIQTKNGTGPGGKLHLELASNTGVNRWGIGLQGDEGPGDAGSDIRFFTYKNDGSFLGAPLGITRSTGAVTITGALAGTSAVFSGALTAANLSTGVESATTSDFSINGLTLTGKVNEQHWSKVGKLVTVSGRLTWTGSSGTASGGMSIGMPFVAAFRNRYVTVRLQTFQHDAGTVSGYVQGGPGKSLVINADVTALTTISSGEAYYQLIYLTA